MIVPKRYQTTVIYMTVQGEIVREVFKSSLPSISEDSGILIDQVLAAQGKILLVFTSLQCMFLSREEIASFTDMLD